MSFPGLPDGNIMGPNGITWTTSQADERNVAIQTGGRGGEQLVMVGVQINKGLGGKVYGPSNNGNCPELGGFYLAYFRRRILRNLASRIFRTTDDSTVDEGEKLAASTHG